MWIKSRRHWPSTLCITVLKVHTLMSLILIKRVDWNFCPNLISGKELKFIYGGVKAKRLEIFLNSFYTKYMVLIFSQNFTSNGPYVVLNFCKFSDTMVLIFWKMSCFLSKELESVFFWVKINSLATVLISIAKFYLES